MNFSFLKHFIKGVSLRTSLANALVIAHVIGIVGIALYSESHRVGRGLHLDPNECEFPFQKRCSGLIFNQNKQNRSTLQCIVLRRVSNSRTTIHSHHRRGIAALRPVPAPTARQSYSVSDVKQSEWRQRYVKKSELSFLGCVQTCSTRRRLKPTEATER